MSKLKVAFIGCGGMAGAHLNGYLELKRRGLDIFDIVAVADPVEGQTACEHCMMLFGRCHERRKGKRLRLAYLSQI